MKFYSKLVNNSPSGLPISSHNMYYLIEDFNIDVTPDGYVEVIVTDPPSAGVYEKFIPDSFKYVKEGNVYKQVWDPISKMTSAEIVEKQNKIKTEWQENPNTFKSWIFNEKTGIFEAPNAYPLDGNDYIWDEPSVSWKLFNG